MITWNEIHPLRNYLLIHKSLTKINLHLQIRAQHQ